MNRKIRLIGLIWIGVVTAVHAQDTTKAKSFDFSKFKPIVHFFANAEYNASAGASKDYSFWLGRTMFGFQYQYDKHWSGTVLVDRTRLAGSVNSLYVKFANLRWTPNNRLAIEAGAVKQNNFIPFETLWGYRFVAETFQDRYYGIASSDLGLVTYYRINDKLSVDAALTNGEGPKIDQDDFGKLKLGGGLNFNPNEHIRTRIFYHLKSWGDTGLTVKEQLFNAFAGYQNGEKFRFGAEFIYVDGFLNVPDTKSYGGTAFGCITLYKSLKFLARYDKIIIQGPDNQIVGIPVSGDALITGISLSPLRSITLCLNYQGFYPVGDEVSPTHRLLFSFEYKL